MAIVSGFFNSEGGDRKYDATAINSFMEGFVTEGVLSPVGGGLAVTAAGGMQISVASGKAWFLQTFLHNTQPRLYELDPSDINFDRIDVVALDFDITNRTNSIIIVKGTPTASPVAPTLVDTSVHKQVPLAHITVSAGVTTITGGYIINKIGSDDTPLCTGLLQQMSIEDLAYQWDANYNEWKYSIENDLEEIDTSGTLAELDDIRERSVFRRNKLINGDFRIRQHTLNKVESVSNSNLHARGVADRWQFYAGTTSGGVWDLERISLGGGLYSFRATTRTAATYSDSSARAMFWQGIEGNNAGEWHKGTAQAKAFALSFKFKTNTAGTYICQLYDSTNSRSASGSFYHNGNGLFQSFEINFPPDFTGQFNINTNDELRLFFWVGAGSDYTNGTALATTWGSNSVQAGNRCYGLTNGGTTIGDFFEWTDVQLEVGEYATAFERLPLNDQLIQCQRYYEYYGHWECIGRIFRYYSGLQKIHVTNANRYGAPKRVHPELYYDDLTLYTPNGTSAASLGTLSLNKWTDPGATATDWNHYVRPHFYIGTTVNATDTDYWIDISGFEVYADYYE
jgi:hypothetical protein